ncbi:uncharacterized protein LOC116341270 [Contarinia nasturtii]|uniref:uncharacterized protein LOC116341270 n=1 Tax=Contarinia nasturtii TaxID=265458 RepID=UPI0012D43D5A|nr:uncharacterized protein LOC116341270 [Contarinia nasturtii]
MVDRSEYIIDQSITEGMENLLARLIRKYPVIYDRSMKLKNGGQSFQEKYDIAWNKISDELNLELESCKSLWSCMKQKYIKHRKRIDNNEPTSAWPTFNILHVWLDKHVKKRKSRHDYIKQMKMVSKTSLARSEISEEDDSNEHTPEEMEDKPTATIQVKLKRKADYLNTIAQNSSFKSNNKRLNIELVSESESTVYEKDDLLNETQEKMIIDDAEIIVLEESRAKQPSPQIEIIDVKESRKSNDIDENYHKIKSILSNFAQSIEHYENNASDSNDAFGKYIAAMVRELPVQKRMKVRLNILEYVHTYVANETNQSNN